MKVGRLFFDLLRSSLWDTSPDANLFEELSKHTWMEIYELSKSQAVVSLVFQSVSRLESRLQPDTSILVEWFMLAHCKEQYNIHCREVLGDIVDMYARHGVEFILLKGLGVAELYPNPLWRDGGDIDLLIINKYEYANELLVKLGGTFIIKNPEHVSYLYRGVTIENHHRVAFFEKKNKLLMSFMTSLGCDSYGVRTFGATANAVYLTQHIAVHFFGSGIGLRHLCDLCRLFSLGNVDLDITRQSLRSLGCEAFFRRLSSIMVRDLGVSVKELPFDPIDDRLTKLIRNEIMAGGNFGFTKQKRQSLGILDRKIVTFGAILKRGYVYRSMCGSLVLGQVYESAIANFQNIFAWK